MWTCSLARLRSEAVPDGWAFYDDPCGRMIAGTIASPDCPIDACVLQARGNRRAEQQMIKAKAGVLVGSARLVYPPKRKCERARRGKGANSCRKSIE